MPPKAPHVLTEEAVLQKTNVTRLADVRNINVWGEQLDDVSIVSRMRHVEVVAFVANRVTELKPFAACAQLKELYLRKNLISSLAELNALRGLKVLETLWLLENPCCTHPHYRSFAIFCCPNLSVLDDCAVTREERERATNLMTPAFVEGLLGRGDKPNNSPRRQQPKPTTPSPRPVSPSAVPRVPSREGRPSAERGPESKPGKPPVPMKASPKLASPKPPTASPPAGGEQQKKDRPSSAPVPETPTRAHRPSASPQEAMTQSISALLPALSLEAMEHIHRQLSEQIARERRRRAAAGGPS